MARWRPALRMARRDLRRHRLRAALTVLLVALPVAGATGAAMFSHNTRWDGEPAAHERMGAADALLEVSRYAQVRVGREAGGWLSLRPASFTRDGGRKVPVRRDPSDVRLTDLLPAGSRVLAAPVFAQRRLASGGAAQVTFLDAADPMALGLAGVVAGRVPSRPEEVAVPRAMADELGMLDRDGRLRRDATLSFAGGTVLMAVGLTDPRFGHGPAASVLAAPSSVLHHRAPTSYLVDLPDLTGPQVRALARSLAGHGIGMVPRDAFFHPVAWGVAEASPSPVDAKALAVGALVVLFGLVEVVLVVGSAFAVSARRQVRDLGLLATAGGAPADVRRVLLAQGLVLGAGASVLGAAAGIGAFHLGVPLYERLFTQPVWTRDVPWAAVVGVTVLGSFTGLLAALVPAWSIGRLTPVAALSGRFPVRPGESRAHRPAFVLAGAGLVTLLLAGLWCAAEFAPQEGQGYRQPSSLPVALGGLGLLLLVAGTVWSAPYVVRVVASLGRWLPLSGRFAFRDAARHRFRTAAAAVTLTVTVAGTVFGGFVMQSAAADAVDRQDHAGHTLSIYLDEGARADGDTLRRTALTLRSVLGPVRVMAASSAVAPGRGYRELAVSTDRHDATPVNVLDEGTLRRLAGPDATEALAAFRAGKVVTSAPRTVHDGQIRLGVYPSPRKTGSHWALPAVVVGHRTEPVGEFGTSWISASTAESLGLVVRPQYLQVTAGRTVTSDDLTRLSVHGIDAWSGDVEAGRLRLARDLLLVAAGLVTLLVVGIAVALAAGEGRADVATFAAVGAGPWRRRGLGAMHGLFLGLVGVALGLAIGLPSSASLVQVDGLPGVVVPWPLLGGTPLVVPLLAAAAGWLVTPSRLDLVRRAG